MKLTQNVGTLDRIARVLVGIGLAAAVLAGAVVAPLAYVVATLAALMLATGLSGFCPIYALFGIRTCPVRRV